MKGIIILKTVYVLKIFYKIAVNTFFFFFARQYVHQTVIRLNICISLCEFMYSREKNIFE